MIRALLFLLMFVVVFPSYGATIYRWTDKNGVENFTDDYERVPPEYRKQVGTKVIQDSQGTPPPPPPAEPSKEEGESDRSGVPEEQQKDEKRKEEARPWTTQMKEAEKKEEVADEQLLKNSEDLTERKFGSHQFYKSKILDIDRIKGEKSRYEARLNEAKEMLRKISPEEEVSKADRKGLKISDWPGPMGSEDFEPGEKTDIYGRDETWWREQVRLRRDQLKEAIQDYEKTYEAYLKKIESVGPSRFGGMSRTQYQFFANQLDDLRTEMEKRQARVDEIKESFKKLAKEARESKANPEWLKL